MRVFGLGRISLAGLLMGLCTLASVGPVSADTPGMHPAYLHGLHDLRIAHALLDHPGNPNVDNQEVRALRSIDAAYGFALWAAELDRKDIHAYEPIDANLHHRDRIVRAIAALYAARRDFAVYESEGVARGWRHDAIIWVDRAIIHARMALHDERAWDQGY